MTIEEAEKKIEELQDEIRAITVLKIAQSKIHPYAKLRLCRSCGLEVWKMSRKCPSCGDWTTDAYEKKYRILEGSRNEAILKDCESRDFTLEQMGEKYRVTRERIRQIYKQMTGKKYQLRNEKKREIKAQKREEWLDSVSFNCTACGKSVTHRGAGYKYCNDCWKIRLSQRNPNLWKICFQCLIKFHPYYHYNSQGVANKFCSKECYGRSDLFFTTSHSSKNSKFLIRKDKIQREQGDMFTTHDAVRILGMTKHNVDQLINKFRQKKMVEKIGKKGILAIYRFI